MNAKPVLHFESDLLNRDQAPTYLGVSPRTLAVWKSIGRYDLPVCKLGRLVKYRKSDLDAFIQRNVIGAALLRVRVASKPPLAIGCCDGHGRRLRPSLMRTLCGAYLRLLSTLFAAYPRLMALLCATANYRI